MIHSSRYQQRKIGQWVAIENLRKTKMENSLSRNSRRAVEEILLRPNPLTGRTKNTSATRQRRIKMLGDQAPEAKMASSAPPQKLSTRKGETCSGTEGLMTQAWARKLSSTNTAKHKMEIKVDLATKKTSRKQAIQRYLKQQAQKKTSLNPSMVRSGKVDKGRNQQSKHHAISLVYDTLPP
jgi:hypothetical protein